MDKLHRIFTLIAPYVWGLAMIASLVVGEYYIALLQFIIVTYALKEYADQKIKDLEDEIS